MTIYELFTLLGGVGLFLFGMSMMSAGLKNAAGDKLKGILEHATANRFISVLVGILVTLLVQSSSATDMMVISFVNSGLMTLIQAIGVIMGANIGTTITAQITAFNLGAYAPIILFIGAVMYLFLKKNLVKHIGSIIMGFGMLFVGISTIKGAIAPLSQSAAFINFLGTLENPLIAILFGIAFTALLQSSSSSVVIFQAFAVQGLLGYNMTVYLIIGAAVGSVTPNILASLTTNRNGKRTAVLNLLFNTIRMVIMVALINIFPQFLTLIQNLTPDSIGHQVANTHTIFAILAVLIELPLANTIVGLSQKIIPLHPEESRKLEERKLHYLVQNGLPSSLAIQQARLEISRMGKIVRDSLADALECFYTGNMELVESVFESEDTVDYLTDIITEKLISMKSMEYSPRELSILSQMMVVVSDLERISDHAKNVAEYAVSMKDKKAKLSPEGLADMKMLSEKTLESVDLSLVIFGEEKNELIPEERELEQLVDDIHDSITNKHVKRLMSGTCGAFAGIMFTDMAIDLERCSDHAMNIATAMVEHGASA